MFCMNDEKVAFEMPVLTTFQIDKIENLNVSVGILKELNLTPWA